MSERVRYERTGAAVTRRARQTPPGARPSRTVDPARRGPGGPQRWMAAPDRIRLTGSLRKGPRKGALLFPGPCGSEPRSAALISRNPQIGNEGLPGAAEDPGLARLRPLVLHPGERPKAPLRKQI